MVGPCRAPLHDPLNEWEIMLQIFRRGLLFVFPIAEDVVDNSTIKESSCPRQYILHTDMWVIHANAHNERARALYTSIFQNVVCIFGDVSETHLYHTLNVPMF